MRRYENCFRRRDKGAAEDQVLDRRRSGDFAASQGAAGGAVSDNLRPDPVRLTTTRLRGSRRVAQVNSLPLQSQLMDGLMAQSAMDAAPPRKRLKLSDLPLTQAKRSAIDGLLHTFKKKGEFDTLRKRTYAQFEEGVSLVSQIFWVPWSAKRYSRRPRQP